MYVTFQQGWNKHSLNKCRELDKIQAENDMWLSQRDQSENKNITFHFGTHQSSSIEKF